MIKPFKGYKSLYGSLTNNKEILYVYSAPVIAINKRLTGFPVCSISMD